MLLLGLGDTGHMKRTGHQHRQLHGCDLLCAAWTNQLKTEQVCSVGKLRGVACPGSPHFTVIEPDTGERPACVPDTSVGSCRRLLCVILPVSSTSAGRGRRGFTKTFSWYSLWEEQQFLPPSSQSAPLVSLKRSKTEKEARLQVRLALGFTYWDQSLSTGHYCFYLFLKYFVWLFSKLWFSCFVLILLS